MISSFFFKDTATTEIYTLSLHDALPILEIPTSWMLNDAPFYRHVYGMPNQMADLDRVVGQWIQEFDGMYRENGCYVMLADRKSTRLNSSHANISYAVFCLKKKKQQPAHS